MKYKWTEDPQSEKTALSNEKKYFVDICATELLCCLEKTFFQIDKYLKNLSEHFVDSTKFLVDTTKILLDTSFSQCEVVKIWF